MRVADREVGFRLVSVIVSAAIKPLAIDLSLGLNAAED